MHYKARFGGQLLFCTCSVLVCWFQNSCILCAVFILIYYWKQYIFNDNLALHMYLYFICSSLEYKIRDGHGVIYVCMGGGEGRARLLGLGPDFFPNVLLWQIFSLFFNIRLSTLCKNKLFGCPKSV